MPSAMAMIRGYLCLPRSHRPSREPEQQDRPGQRAGEYRLDAGKDETGENETVAERGGESDHEEREEKQCRR